MAGSDHGSLVAVCDDGCPDWKPSCADIYNQPPTESALHCPVWPQEWNAMQRWTVLNATDGKGDRNATASSYCCKRKADECDKCVRDETCHGLTGIFSDHCPPKPPPKFHPITPLQEACCQHVSNPVLPFNECSCKVPPTVCDHDAW